MRMRLRILMGGILLAAACTNPMAWADQAPRRIEVTAKQFAFEPGEITVKKGEPVVLVLKSADVAHGLSIHDLHVDVKVTAGGTAEVTFTPEKTGDFVGRCSVFCGAHHGSMMFKVHVVD